MAPIGNTSWVCYLRWESYALEQAERLKSHVRAKKFVHTFAWNPLYLPTEGNHPTGCPKIKLALGYLTIVSTPESQKHLRGPKRF